MMPAISNASATAAILRDLAEPRTIDRKVMIVVAHPDDETIGMGAQLCRFNDARLIYVTNGAPRDGLDAAAHGYPTVAAYADARRVELAAALAVGEARAVRTEFIGVTDQEACFDLALTGQILGFLSKETPEAVFVHAYEGGHPDHDAASFAVGAACRLIQAHGEPGPTIVEMTGYHAEGEGLATNTFLPATQPVISSQLTAVEQQRKQRMLDCFTSQREVLAGFGVVGESFRETPTYDFTRPPHSGPLHYERLGWKISGEVWRQQARLALDRLGLLACPKG
jgi:LmbE family N-acetylglucosaminyl deacetylase